MHSIFLPNTDRRTDQHSKLRAWEGENSTLAVPTKPIDMTANQKCKVYSKMVTGGGKFQKKCSETVTRRHVAM